MDKRETIKITGTSHYADNIKTLMLENPDYSLKDKELLEEYEVGDDIPEYESAAKHVELIPEPDNQYDSNAVRCEIEGVTVGYVKKGSCSHVKNLLSSPDFKYVMIDKLFYGNTKHVYSDDDDKPYIEVKEYDNPVVHLIIATEAAPESVTIEPQEKELPPANTEVKKQKIPLPLLILIASFLLILLFAVPVLGIIAVIVAIVLFVKMRKEDKNGNST